MGTKRYIAVVAAAALAASCAAEQEQASPETASSANTSSEQSHQQIKTGNGERNYIILDGAIRDGATFTFKEVAIAAPGWLVMHPFDNGAPVRTEYVGATLLEEGKSADVQITVDSEPMPGEMFIVMLHYDINEDGVFDFNDGVTVPDAPVFEGDVLIALRYSAE